MAKKQEALLGDGFDELSRGIPYIIAGLQGYTDGAEIISVTVQQNDFSGFRVILRALQITAAGDRVRVVGFTSGSGPTECLYLAEQGYRENKIRWHVDKFAESSAPDHDSKTKQLSINR